MFVFSYQEKPQVTPHSEVLLNRLCLDIIALSSKWRVGENYQVHKHTEEYSTFLSLFRSFLSLHISPFYTVCSEFIIYRLISCLTR